MAEPNDEQARQAALRAAAKKIYYRREIADYFAQQIKIRTKEMGVSPFIPKPSQQSLIKAAQRQLGRIGKIRQIIFKPRQFGGSTYTSGIVGNRTFMYSGVYSFIVAQDKTTVANLFEMYEIQRNNLEPEIRPEIQYFNKGTDMTVLPDPDGIGSKILVGEAKNAHLGIGQTIHCLGLSEVCRYPTSTTIKDSVIPACSDAPGTVRIYESTAFFGGGADWFRYQCERAQRNDDELEYHFVEWWKDPDYIMPLKRGEKLKLTTEEKYFVKKLGFSLENVKWRRSKIHDLEGDEDSFKLSYPVTFEEAWINRSNTAFPQARVAELSSMLRPPIAQFRIVNVDGKMRILAHQDGELSVWFNPEPGKTYDLGADISEGHEDGDYSAAEVIERGSNKQCAEWHGRVMPMEFAEILAAIGRWYNTAQIAPETNSNISAVHRLGEIYPNVYIWRKQDSVGVKMTNMLGWETSNRSKKMLVDLAHHRLYYRQVQIFSTKLWNEIKNFGRDYTDSGNATYRAISGHDDLCMAWLIAIKTSDDENFDRYHSSSVDSERDKKQNERPPDYLVDSSFSQEFIGSLQKEIGAWD